jgi:hypothetical protein
LKAQKKLEKKNHSSEVLTASNGMAADEMQMSFLAR